MERPHRVSMLIASQFPNYTEKGYVDAPEYHVIIMKL